MPIKREVFAVRGAHAVAWPGPPWGARGTGAGAAPLLGHVRRSSQLPDLRSESIVEQPEIDFEFKDQSPDSLGRPYSHRQHPAPSKNAGIFKGL